CDFAEDVDPAAAPDGAGRDCAARGASSGAAESRVWVDGVGTSTVPRARCPVAMGGRAHCHGMMAASVVSGWEVTHFGDENEKCTRSVRKNKSYIVEELGDRFGLFLLPYLCQVAE